MVLVSVTGESHFSTIGLHSLHCLPRPCPLGEESNPVNLAINGQIIYSYSPAHDHYYFSQVPDNKWFTNHYLYDWGSNGKASISHAGTVVNLFKGILGPVKTPLKKMKNLLRTNSTIRNQAYYVNQFTRNDVERSFTTFLSYLPIGGSVVEIGCGGGDFLLPFSRAGYQVGGFEPSPESASQARAEGISIFGGFATDDERTRKVLSSADLVMSNHSLEHHYDPNVFLSLCARHMKPESVLGITVPNGDGSSVHTSPRFLHPCFI